MKIAHTTSKLTARELLVSLAGDAHADHTVTKKVDAGVSIMINVLVWRYLRRQWQRSEPDGVAKRV